MAVGGKLAELTRLRRVAPLVVALAVAVPGTTATAATGMTRYVAPGGSDAGNECVEAAAPCATIQHAVDETAAGDTVDLAAGTYVEQVTIGKPLTLRGPNAGVDPNTEPRGAEAIVDGGGGIAIRPDAEGITIDGLTVSTSDAGEPIYTGVSDIDGLTIANDIVGSGVRAITIETAGEGISIEHNLIEGKGYGVILAEGAYRDLAVEDNVFAGPLDYYAMFNAGGSFEGFELRGNTVGEASNIGGSVIGGTVSGNVFDVDSPGSIGLQIDLHESVLTGNAFEGHGTTACLQLFGSQYGLDPSTDATVTENSFHDCDAFAIQLSPDMERIAIAGNTIVRAYDGVDTRDITSWDPSGAEIRIFANRIVNSAHMGVANTVGGTLDARGNWWGCNAGPTTDGSSACDTISPGVDASSWLLLTAAAEPTSVLVGHSSTIGARIDSDSAGVPSLPAPDGTPVSFSTDVGMLSTVGAPLAAGSASTVLNSDTSGQATVGVTVDRETVSVPVRVDAPSAPGAASSPPPPSLSPGLASLILPDESTPLPVAPGGRLKVGTITCPNPCRVAIRTRRVKVGRWGFGIALHTRKWLGHGQSSAVWATLPRRARRALATRGGGRAIVRLRFWSAHVRTVAARLRLEPQSHRP
jgi:nitrous oxidase accessory protein NosD